MTSSGGDQSRPTAALDSLSRSPGAKSGLKTFLPVLIFGAFMTSPILVMAKLPDLLILTACILCFLLAILSRHNSSHALHFFYVVFLYLALYPFFVQEIADVVLNATQREVAPMAPRTFTATTLFLIAVAIPNAFGSMRQQRANSPSSAGARLAHRSLLIPALALLVFCSVSIHLVGMDAFFSTRSAASLQVQRSSVLMVLTNVIRLSPCWFMFFLLWKRIKNRHSIFSAKVFLLLILIVIVNNPVTTPRFISLTGLLVAFFPLLLVRGYLATFTNAFPLLVWIVLPLTSLLRGGLVRFGLPDVYNIALKSLEFSSMATLNEWMASGPRGSLTWGLHTLSSAFVFVPRLIWPAKGTGAAILVAEEAGFSFSNFTNVGVPPLTDFFLDFGWFGILAGGLVVGSILRSFPISDFDRINCFSTFSCVPVMLFALTPLFVRGGLATFFIALYTLLISHRVTVFLLKLKA